MSTLRYKLAALKGRGLRLRKPSRRTLIIGAIIVLVVALFTFRALNNGADEPENETTPSVATIDVKDYRTNAGIVQASGEVTSVNQVTVKSEVSVPVRSVLVNIGEQVFAGQPLVEFEHADLDAQLAQANAGVAQAQAGLDVQLVGARSEDLERARLAVAQAEQALFQSIATRDQTETANETALIDVEQSVLNTYEDSVQTAQSVLATAIDGIVVVADYQRDYFNCSSHTICREIKTAKSNAMQSIFDVNQGGEWNAQTVLIQEGGLVARVSALQAATVIDPAELQDVLADLETGLQETRTALVLTRQGLDTGAGSGSTVTDRTTVETERAAIDAAIVTLQTQVQAQESVEGGRLVGGEAKSISDERIRAEASQRAVDAAVAVAEISLASAQQSLAILENGPRGVDLAALQAGVFAAEAARDNVAAQFRRYIITAPFDGVVATLPARAGEAVGAGQTVVSIVNPSALEIVAYVSDTDRPLMTSGASVTINDAYSGVVTFISPSIDPSTGKVETRIAVLDTDAVLTIGQVIPVEIELADIAIADDTFQLPLPSVRIRPTGSFVLVLNEENIVEERLVETGAVFGERVEILSGLNINDTIIASVRGLDVGDTVTTR